MNYDIIDSDFNKKLSTAYQLSILVGMDSLVYFVFETANDQALLLRSYSFPARQDYRLKNSLNDIFTRDELLGFLYRRVKIILPVFSSALVPERLYNEAEKTTYLDELSSHGNSAAVQMDEMSELSLKVVYESMPELTGVMKKQFPTGRFYAGVTPFLAGCRKMMSDEQIQATFVNFHREVCQVAVFQRRNLLFYNAFPYSTAADVTYYVLLALSQHNIDPAVARVFLMGQILENSEIYKMLYRYVGNLRFLPPPPFLKFGRKFSEAPPHLYFDLYALALCK